MTIAFHAVLANLNALWKQLAKLMTNMLSMLKNAPIAGRV
jgi:hypothetical protein